MMGTYTNEEKVEALLQLDINDGSVPTSAQLSDIIDEVESRIEARGLGRHEVENAYVNVPDIGAQQKAWQWWYETASGVLSIGLPSGIIVPLSQVRSPIIEISKLEVNTTSEYGLEPVWEELVEWPNSGASFLLLSGGKRDLGYALWFFDNIPDPGPKRIRMTYYWGHNIDESILSDYCTCLAGIKVLLVRMGSNRPDGLATLQSQDLGYFVNTNYKDRIAELKARVEEIEAKYFPPSAEINEVSMVVV